MVLIVIDFIENNWNMFIDACSQHGLSEEEAEELFETWKFKAKRQ